MGQPPRDLHELSRRFGGRYLVECRCGRCAEFSVSDLSAFWKAKKWSPDFKSIASHFRCQCGRKAMRAYYVDHRAADYSAPPTPPTPERTAEYRPAGIEAEAWANAKTDQDRKRLIRRARG